MNPGASKRTSVLLLLLLSSLTLASAIGQERTRMEPRAGQGEPLLRFTRATSAAGLIARHDYHLTSRPTEAMRAVSGVAAGDVNGDGWTDLYIIRGPVGSNYLYINQRNGTFVNRAAEYGVDLDQERGSGPTLADFDGDGWLDLFIGGVSLSKPLIYRNQAGQRFEEVTEETGIEILGDTFSSALSDYDRDGDLDVFFTHWIGSLPEAPDEVHLWRNDGDGTFTGLRDVDIGLDYFQNFKDYSLTGNFADINNDGWLDLLVAADFGTSQVFLSRRDGTFENITDPAVITDENGMGAAIGDYDHDGDLDWFVSSIWDDQPAVGWGITGNRLYRNRGDGTFEDATEESGVRIGYWGWGSCFADFNNDAHLDLFHVNGFNALPGRAGGSSAGEKFLEDPSRLFISNRDGSFTEVSEQVDLIDTKQGRGVVCFDYDRDGDVDIFVANNSDSHDLFRNDLEPGNNFLQVRLRGEGMNGEAVGARIYVTSNGLTQMRELRAGSNYVSQQPCEAHFGLGQSSQVDRLTVVWPDGEVDIFHDIPANRFLFLKKDQNHPRTLLRRPWNRSRP